MKETMSRVVDGFMRSKSRDAVVVCFLFGMGWMLSPWMALFAAGLYFKLMRNKARGWGATGRMGRSESRQMADVSHFQKEFQPMQPTKPKMEPKDWLIAIVGGFYLISPIDFLPEFIPGIGLVDDVGVAIFLFKYFYNKFGKTKEVAPPTGHGRSVAVRPNDPRFDDDIVDVEVMEVRRGSI